MATNMNTIQFGENGKVYNVNAPVVAVNRELAEAATILDFGTFEPGLTDLFLQVDGVKDAAGDYFHFVVNGTKTAFISSQMYSSGHSLRIKKVGSLWWVDAHSQNIGAGNTIPYLRSALAGAETITSIAIEAYSGSTFAAGTKYALEGR